MNNHISLNTTELIKNFPLRHRRDSQTHVLNEICEAFNSGYKHILLEASTGFGKSPVAVALALTMGTSYICTSTKDLQTQYSRDFPFLRTAKGMNNFRCFIREDHIRNGINKCGACSSSSYTSKKRINANAYCSHTTVDYGPCLTRNNEIALNGCVYKPSLSDYEVIDRGTNHEQVFMNAQSKEKYQHEYSKWLQTKNLTENHMEWTPCGYYDQLNIARNAGHSIFNYPMFLTLLPNEKKIAPRDLLILDEGHLLEAEVLSLTGFILSKSKWRKYLPGFSIIYSDDIETWINFLIQLEAKMLALLGDEQKIKELLVFRKQNYNWKSMNILKIKKIINTRITDFFIPEGKDNLREDANNNNTNDGIEELEDAIAEYLGKKISSRELADQASLETEKLTQIIEAILSNPKNWVVSKIKREDDELIEVEFKPLDISPYCKNIFNRCSKTLVMSATILNADAYCRNVGLNIDDVKFIEIQSDFPIENRPIYPLNIAYLNYDSLQLQETKSNVAKAVDSIMTTHRNDKGIIHTTSYEQLNFIKENISQDNVQRLLVTDPDIQREVVIAEHIKSIKPTVIISPSLHTGIDLTDDLSRFQIITKIPYPNLADRWIGAKTHLDGEWYYWQTALRLVQAYGRSIRSKDDWAKTYVLDSAFNSFVNKNRNLFPDWFKQAIKGHR